MARFLNLRNENTRQQRHFKDVLSLPNCLRAAPASPSNKMALDFDGAQRLVLTYVPSNNMKLILFLEKEKKWQNLAFFQ